MPSAAILPKMWSSMKFTEAGMAARGEEAERERAAKRASAATRLARAARAEAG